MKVRSVIAYILFIGMISIFPVAFVLSAAVSDSFANGTLRGRFNPMWIGFGVATLVVAAICMRTRISAKRVNSNQRISRRQLMGFLLLVFAYLVFSGWMLTDAGERLLVRTTSHESRYYLTSAQPMSRKCQNPVTWYDRQVDGMVFTCSTFALFNYPADWNARRASIVHVMTGPYGIRVLSIHAIDSFFGQQDLKAMKDRR
jgi:cytochrome b561